MQNTHPCEELDPSKIVNCQNNYNQQERELGYGDPILACRGFLFHRVWSSREVAQAKPGCSLGIQLDEDFELN
jgi:hypothetical protein